VYDASIESKDSPSCGQTFCRLQQVVVESKGQIFWKTELISYVNQIDLI